MKKVISVFLAVLMLLGTCGIVGTAADETTTGTPTIVPGEVYCKADYCVSLVFNYMSYQVGTVHMGELDKVTAGENQGCYVLRAPSGFTAGNFVQLPEIKDTGDGTYGVWYVASTTVPGEPLGYTLSGGSLYQIPKTAANGEFIVFLAMARPLEETSVIATIMGVFAKIIGVIFGKELQGKFMEIIGEFGLG